MSNDRLNELLQQGIAAARGGDKESARSILQEVIKLDMRNETAWLWLSSVAENNKERLFCLRQVLQINPQNEHAIKAMQKFSSGASSGDTSAAPPKPSGSVPYLDPKRFNALGTQLDEILSRVQAPPSASLPFDWVKKTRGRIGDAAATRLRAVGLLVAAVVLVAVIGLGALIVSNIGGPVKVVADVTETPTPTITLTPTRTPGTEPTASNTPRVKVDPSNTPSIPGGTIGQMTATAPYPLINSNSVQREAQGLYAIGKYQQVIPTLDEERRRNETEKNSPSSSYYQLVYYLAMSYVEDGSPGKALALLQNNQKADSAFYHAALAATYYAQENYDDALTEANAALRLDPKLVQSSIIAARVYLNRAEYSRAEDEVAAGLRQEPRNAALFIERAKIRLASGKVDTALNDALLALYIDPTNREGFIVRGNALLASATAQADPTERVQSYGTAVIAAQEFLFYYPGDTTAWLLYGQAREGEGNLTAALDAYAQAVVVDKESPAAREVLLARGKLLLDERRYAEAVEDFQQANRIRETDETRRLLLKAALDSGDYTAALEQVNRLLQDTPDNTDLLVEKLDLLIRARAASAGSDVDRQNFAEEVSRVDDAFINGLNPQNQAVAHLYRGIAMYDTKQLDVGLIELNRSLALTDSGTARYFRALINDTQNRPEQALLDYHWLLYWSNFTKYPFIDDVRERAGQVVEALPTHTPTHTLTSTPSLTPTNTPSLTPTPSRTQTPSRTPVPSRTPIPSRTPVPSRTPRPTNTP